MLAMLLLLQHLSALKDLGCTSLTILIGVADGSGKTTHQDDYGLLASEGVTKRVPTADGHKRLFAVMDGAGPLKDALENCEHKHNGALATILMRLLNVMSDHIAVSCKTGGSS
jgi:hypothetical protein